MNSNVQIELRINVSFETYTINTEQVANQLIISKLTSVSYFFSIMLKQHIALTNDAVVTSSQCYLSHYSSKPADIKPCNYLDKC